MDAKSGHVLLVTHYFPSHGGGIEIVAGQFASRLGNAGWRIQWFSSGVDVPPELPGVEACAQRTWNISERALGIPFPLWSPIAYARLVASVRDAAVVHIHDCHYPANVVAALAAKASGTRLIVTQHVGNVPYRRTFLRALLALVNRVVVGSVLRHADCVLFVSPVVRAYFEGIIGARSSFQDRPNGVDTELFRPVAMPMRLHMREELRIPSDAPVALFVGRFVEKKGLELVRALAMRMPDWTWLLIGDGPIDPDEWELSNVRKLGRKSQVEVANFYRVAHVLVLPSVGEGFPLVIQEALASGCPVAVHTETWVAGDLGPEAGFGEPVTGKNAAERWERRLRNLMSVETADSATRSEVRRAFAISRWSWEAAVEGYVEAFAARKDGPTGCSDSL